MFYCIEEVKKRQNNNKSYYKMSERRRVLTLMKTDKEIKTLEKEMKKNIKVL